MNQKPRYTITLDDDVSISQTIAQATGIPSYSYTDCELLLEQAPTLNPLAIFIEVHLGANHCGLDLVADIRKIWAFIPIIVITADPKSELIGQALAIGANDFIHKPINPVELNGRLHGRMLEMSNRQRIDVLTIGDIEFTQSQALLRKDGRVSYLPKLETALLAILIEQRELIVAREELKQRLWGRIAVSENTLDRKISDIRKALGAVGSHAILQSHYRKGISLSFPTELKKVG